MAICLVSTTCLHLANCLPAFFHSYWSFNVLCFFRVHLACLNYVFAVVFLISFMYVFILSLLTHFLWHYILWYELPRCHPKNVLNWSPFLRSPGSCQSPELIRDKPILQERYQFEWISLRKISAGDRVLDALHNSIIIISSPNFGIRIC